MKTSVEVLLREHVDNLGKCGDVVRVAAGYARNYLMPRLLAVPATEENKRTMARRRARLDVEEVQRMADVARVVQTLSELVVQTDERADEQGHLYGSVSAAKVAELVTAAGIPVDEKHVRLDAPIKTVGTHAVPVHVHGDAVAEVTVEVRAEG
jgi:large subunit ribosomal protein L9